MGAMYVSFGSPFSAVSKPMFATEDSFCSIFGDLQFYTRFPAPNATCSKSSYQMFSIFRILQKFPRFCHIFTKVPLFFR